ncbi:MAG: hypothetical protein ACREAN_08930 [Nitrosopumilaceae archaeon]
MKENEPKKHDYVETLKSNYRQRIQEMENFSRHFSENSIGVRSEFLTGVLEISQYYIDLQKKFMSRYPKWYDDILMTKNSQIITEMFTQGVRNLDSFYSEFLSHALKNFRVINRIGMQMMQTSERYYDMFEDIPQLQKDTFIELIKEAKQYNENYVKENLEKKTLQNHKIKPKKETLSKNVS